MFLGSHDELWAPKASPEICKPAWTHCISLARTERWWTMLWKENTYHGGGGKVRQTKHLTIHPGRHETALTVWWEDKIKIKNVIYRDEVEQPTESRKKRSSRWCSGWQRNGDDKQPHYSHLNVSGWTAAHLFCAHLKCCPRGCDPFASAALIESDDKQQKCVNLQVWVCECEWGCGVGGVLAGKNKDDLLNLSASVFVSLLCLAATCVS